MPYSLIFILCLKTLEYVPGILGVNNSRGGSRTAATLTIITKFSTLDVAAVLDPSLNRHRNSRAQVFHRIAGLKNFIQRKASTVYFYV